MTARTFEALVASYGSDVERLALRARELIRETVPEAEESVDAKGPYVTYGYGPGYKGVVCYLTVSKQGVKLGLAGGASLPDPKGLLRGEGKSNRHVPLVAQADLRQPGVRQLLRAALAAWKKRGRAVARGDTLTRS